MQDINIINNLNHLVKEISNYVINLDDFMPKLKPCDKYSGKFLKGFEDMLDAIICALIGVYYLKGKAIPYGDELGAIWVPEVSRKTKEEIIHNKLAKEDLHNENASFV